MAYLTLSDEMIQLGLISTGPEPAASQGQGSASVLPSVPGLPQHWSWSSSLTVRALSQR